MTGVWECRSIRLSTEKGWRKKHRMNRWFVSKGGKRIGRNGGETRCLDMKMQSVSSLSNKNSDLAVVVELINNELHLDVEEIDCMDSWRSRSWWHVWAAAAQHQLLPPSTSRILDRRDALLPCEHILKQFRFSGGSWVSLGQPLADCNLALIVPAWMGAFQPIEDPEAKCSSQFPSPFLTHTPRGCESNSTVPCIPHLVVASSTPPFLSSFFSSSSTATPPSFGRISHSRRVFVTWTRKARLSITFLFFTQTHIHFLRPPRRPSLIDLVVVVDCLCLFDHRPHSLSELFCCNYCLYPLTKIIQSFTPFVYDLYDDDSKELHSFSPSISTTIRTQAWLISRQSIDNSAYFYRRSPTI